MGDLRGHTAADEMSQWGTPILEYSKEHVETSLGRMFVRTRIAQHNDATLFFWSGLFFDGTMWEGIVSSFSDEYNIVVLDPPGHGASAAPKVQFTMRDCAGVAAQILKHYRIERCIFVGLSWGGFVAQSFLKYHTASCAGLVLMNTCSAPPKISEIILFTIMSKLLAWFGPRRFEASLVSALLSPDSVERNPQLIDRLHNQLYALDYELLRPVFRSVMRLREDLSACILGTDIESLIIYGTQDASMDQGRTDHMISLLPRNTLVEGLDVGHNAALEAPSQVVEALQRYLKKNIN